MKNLLFLALFAFLVSLTGLKAQEFDAQQRDITINKTQIKQLVLSVPGVQDIINQIKDLHKKREALSPQIVVLEKELTGLKKTMCTMAARGINLHPPLGLDEIPKKITALETATPQLAEYRKNILELYKKLNTTLEPIKSKLAPYVTNIEVIKSGLPAFCDEIKNVNANEIELFGVTF